MDLNTWSGASMPTFTERELRRETLQRAIYSRFNGHPEVAGKFLYSDAWLIARHAVEAVLEVEDAAGKPSDGTIGTDPAHERKG